MIRLSHHTLTRKLYCQSELSYYASSQTTLPPASQKMKKMMWPLLLLLQRVCHLTWPVQQQKMRMRRGETTSFLTRCGLFVQQRRSVLARVWQQREVPLASRLGHGPTRVSLTPRPLLLILPFSLIQRIFQPCIYSLGLPASY